LVADTVYSTASVELEMSSAPSMKQGVKQLPDLAGKIKIGGLVRRFRVWDKK